MSMFRSLAFSGAMGLAAVLLPTSIAHAMPLAPMGLEKPGPLAIPARVACNAYSCWNYGPLYSPVYRPGGPIYRPFYRSYYWPPYRPNYRPYYAGPFNRPYYPPYGDLYRSYGTQYYAPPMYTGGSHVQWCASRYRTYNPETDQYHAGGGVYRFCVSPYR